MLNSFGSPTACPKVAGVSNIGFAIIALSTSGMGNGLVVSSRGDMSLSRIGGLIMMANGRVTSGNGTNNENVLCNSGGICSSGLT